MDQTAYLVIGVKQAMVVGKRVFESNSMIAVEVCEMLLISVFV